MDAHAKNTVSAKYVSYIEETRALYTEELATLPPAMREIALRRISVRTKRANGRQLLGECAPWLIADLLGIADVPAIRRLALSWLHVYFFVLMVDDLVDKPRDTIHPQDMIVGSLLFQRGLHALVRGGLCEEGLDAAFLETANAGLREVQGWRQRIQSFAPTPEMIGQKLSLLRICARALMSLVNGRASASPSLDELLNQIGIGIQLLDDLTDLEEDFRAGQLSYPFQLALRRSQALANDFQSSRFGSDTLLLLLESGSLVETLQAATNAFSRALVEVQSAVPNVSNSSRLYIEALHHATQCALDKIQSAQIELTRIDVDHFVKDESLRSAQRIRIAEDVKESLEVVAQSS